MVPSPRGAIRLVGDFHRWLPRSDGPWRVAGEETRTFVEVGSDCWIDVVLTGRFEFR
jgi:hypothetical protein